MEEKLNNILSELQRTNNQLGSLASGQKELIKSQKNFSILVENVERSKAELVNGQKELITRSENLEKGQEGIMSGFNEIKDLIKHNTTLMTENVTYIRKDMKTLAFDVNSDIELLFKEMAQVKRKVNKLEQK
nr:hypothetical protein [Neobacillus sp. Marseille-Q6967]